MCLEIRTKRLKTIELISKPADEFYVLQFNKSFDHFDAIFIGYYELADWHVFESIEIAHSDLNLRR